MEKLRPDSCNKGRALSPSKPAAGSPGKNPRSNPFFRKQSSLGGGDVGDLGEVIKPAETLVKTGGEQTSVVQEQQDEKQHEKQDEKQYENQDDTLVEQLRNKQGDNQGEQVSKDDEKSEKDGTYGNNDEGNIVVPVPDVKDKIDSDNKVPNLSDSSSGAIVVTENGLAKGQSGSPAETTSIEEEKKVDDVSEKAKPSKKKKGWFGK